MKCEDPDILNRISYQTEAHLRLMRKLIDDKESDVAIVGAALYGIGLIDSVCLINEEFAEYRRVAVSDEDNDIQAFAAAARALYDWMKSKGFVLEQIPQ